MAVFIELDGKRGHQLFGLSDLRAGEPRCAQRPGIEPANLGHSGADKCDDSRGTENYSTSDRSVDGVSRTCRRRELSSGTVSAVSSRRAGISALLVDRPINR